MSKELEVAIKAAKMAGSMLLNAKYHDRALGYKDIKDDINDSRKQFVTKMDSECEDAIKKILYESFPNYGILAEESGKENIHSEKIWVIDPIDGTISYSNGLDSFVTAIGLLNNNGNVLSVVYQPTTDRLYFAEKEKGAYLNYNQIFINSTEKLNESIISMDHRIFRIEEYPKATKELVKTIKRLRISESASLEMCLLASGNIDGFIRTMQPTYDYMMGKTIIEEAGGIVTDFMGNSIQIQLNNERNTNILAANYKLHKELTSYFH
jgi:myo-inositol-1(or 4)-monophosphatase